MTLFSGGKEVIDGRAAAPDAEVAADGTETVHASPDQPSWPRRLLDVYVESARQSSAYADRVGRMALSGDIGGAIKAAIGLN